MRQTHFVRTFLVLLVLGSGGCATSRPSWNMFSWGSSTPTAGTAPDLSKQKYDGVAKNFQPGPAAAAAPPATGIAGMWQKTSDTLSAPFKSTPSAAKPDPVSLSTASPKVGVDIYLAAGKLHESRGDMAGAEQQYDRALKTAPNDLNALISMARLQDRQGKFDAAVKYYQRAATSHPKSPLVHNDLGLCYARHQQLDAALKEMNQAVALQPDNQMYRNNYATMLVEGGRDQEALQQFAAVNPPATAHYNLAFLLTKRGNNEAAAEHLRQALSLDRSMVAAEALLAQIQPTAQNIARGPGGPYGGTPASTVGYSNAGGEVGTAVQQQAPPVGAGQPGAIR